MSDGDVQRDLGRLEAQVGGLTKSVEALTEKVDEMAKTISEAKGGWKVFVMFGTASAAVGGLVVKLVPWFSMSGKG